MKSTTHVRARSLEDRWLLYDASQQPLGRMASDIAMKLMGKDRPEYTPSELCGAHVVVVNAERARLTGRKGEQKEYQTYSGYPGGRSVMPLERLRERRPTDIVKLAVRRMLPKSKLGRDMLRRLKVYAGTDHPHQAQKPELVRPAAR